MVHQYLQSQDIYMKCLISGKDFQTITVNVNAFPIKYDYSHSLWNHRRFSYKDIQHYIEQDLQNL